MDDTSEPSTTSASAVDRPHGRALDRQIFSLAVPALGALIAQPLFILIDSAMVGHLGTSQLAGLSLSSTILTAAVAIFNFLLFTATATTARKLGAGDRSGALSAGIDGLWLALILGLIAFILVEAAAPALTHGSPGDVAPHAVSYLRWSAPGLPGMLLVMASTGVLRGLLDTRSPLLVAVSGAVVNTGLNALFMFGLNMGVAGSGLGTAITQALMGGALVFVMLRHARGACVAWRPAFSGIWAATRTGLPIFIRTLSLRAAYLVTVVVATSLGAVTLAGNQVVIAFFGLTALALDALAVASQALVGQSLGAGNSRHARALLRRCVQWGVLGGAVLGVLLAASSWWLALLFTSDPTVRAAAAVGVAILAASLPIGGLVFVLDGVLIGAGDGRYLALASLINVVSYLPLAWLVHALAPAGTAGLAWLWVAFGGGYMLVRAVTNGVRARGSRWMVLGA